MLYFDVGIFSHHAIEHFRLIKHNLRPYPFYHCYHIDFTKPNFLTLCFGILGLLQNYCLKICSPTEHFRLFFCKDF